MISRSIGNALIYWVLFMWYNHSQNIIWYVILQGPLNGLLGWCRDYLFLLASVIQHSLGAVLRGQGYTMLDHVTCLTPMF